MSGGLLQILLQGAAPLDHSSLVGAVVLVFLLLGLIRDSRDKGQRQRDARDNRRTQQLEDEADRERGMRERAEHRGDRWRLACLWWCSTAYDERSGRLNDRRESTTHYAAQLATEALFRFPNLLPLPRVFEEEQEKDGTF